MQAWKYGISDDDIATGMQCLVEVDGAEVSPKYFFGLWIYYTLLYVITSLSQSVLVKLCMVFFFQCFFFVVILAIV